MIPSLEEIAGAHWSKKIKSDIDELVESLSYIHLDELIIKYGEIGAYQYFAFMIEVMSLKCFTLKGNGYLFQYFNKHQEELRPLILKTL